MATAINSNNKIKINYKDFNRDIKIRCSLLTKRLKKSFPKLKDNSYISNSEGSKVAKEYVKILEEELSNIAYNYNRFGLLIALHHVIPPVPLLTKNPDFFSDSQLAFSTCTLVAMKYADSDSSKTKYNLSPTEYLKNQKWAFDFIKNEKIISDVFKIETFTNVLLETQKVFRMAEKGAQVKVNFSSKYPIQYKACSNLIDLTYEYDERTIKESKRNIAAGSGMYGPIWQEKISPVSIPLLRINWEEVANLNSSPHKTSHIGFLPFYDAWIALKEDLKLRFRSVISIEDFMAFILCSFEIIKEMELEKKQIYGLGYDFTTKDRFLGFVENHIEKYKELIMAEKIGASLPFAYTKLVLPKTILKEKVEKILNYIAIKESEANNINLLIQKPCSYIFF